MFDSPSPILAILRVGIQIEEWLWSGRGQHESHVGFLMRMGEFVGKPTTEPL